MVNLTGCLCDLTPDFCDIGCCCDTCGVTNLSTVFTGCSEKTMQLIYLFTFYRYGVCVEKWLMFRANVDSSLVTVTDSLFCVQPTEKFVSTTETAPNFPALGDSYHFVPSEQMTITFTRDFYRVDDLILTYFPKTSARGVLRLPSPGAASALCTNRNPAKFLRSLSFSCSREVTLQSCSTDPMISAQSYIYDLNLIKHPISEADPVTDLLIPVVPSSKWNAPRKQNNSCVNVVKRVEFVIGYTERGEISSAKVNMVLANLDFKQLLLQTHTLQFQLTVIGVSQNGACSNPNTRKPILFGHNSITGCSFNSMVNNCSDLRTQIYDIHQRVAIPDLVAMNSGSQPDWTRVLIEECLVGSQESCDTGCTLPHTLSVRVLWAQQGLLELPQHYILGVKYMFHCSIFKCPLTTSLTLFNEVTFVDTTLYPEPPGGVPQLHWRFPFGFFSRGIDEVDGHILSNSSGSQTVTWILIISTVRFITCLVS
ncbi:hypothetical protein NQD34_014228 [Periophthalmus magnuspinnatus]|nr:hypothetical protein NQD34_014228 [Periophthalmus magnuspinnatus]